MQGFLLDDIDFEVDTGRLLKKLRVDPKSSIACHLADMVKQANEVARPRAYYLIGAIQSRDEDRIVIDDVTLKSRVLQINTRELNRVFPFVATCGSEMEAWAGTFSEMIDRYHADELRLAALREAIAEVERDITRRFGSVKLGQMQPGSLKDWPIHEQEPLFRILGEGAAKIGVSLKDNMLMVPGKSESGIYFEDQKGFKSCCLCPVKHCPSRREPYDLELYLREYAATKGERHD